jgi:signal transduction histidine kinase/ligand-binding sensor domain-containing protein
MRLLIACLLLLLARLAVLAQPSNASFLHYTTDQGLSNDHVRAIVKDNLGFLWVGTVNGLNRFDGRSFKIFKHNSKDEHTLPDDNITGITPAADGSLWVATSGGLCTIDPYGLRIQRIHLPENEDTIRNDVVTIVAFDSKGFAWTTSTTGIYKIDPVSGKVVFKFKTEIPTLAWFGMLIDDQDRLWMLKEYLRRFDPANSSIKLFKGAFPDYTFGLLSLVRDASGRFWGGTWGNGIWYYNDQLDDFIKSSIGESLAVMLLPDVTSTGRQFFWVGGGQSGLDIYYPDTKSSVAFEPNPVDPFTHNNYIATALFKDPSNNDVWIGTEVGLEQYAPATIRFGRAMIPTEKDMGQFSLVSGVVHDNTDLSGQRYFVSVWGTGLFAWDKTTGKFTRMRSTSKFTQGTNFSILQDRHGDLWDCRTDGISRYNPYTGEFRDYEVLSKVPNRSHNFWFGTEDQEGNLWFGSRKDGLYTYNPQTDRVELALYDEKLADRSGLLSVFDIAVDSSGHLWLACNASGLIRFDPATREAKQFLFPGHNEPLSCNAVRVAKSGKIYAAFYTDFLELDGEGNILRQFNEENGLKTNRIYYMVEDQQGKIWFNSVYLLHCFDPATGTFTYYGKPDGLFGNSVTDGLSITPDGEIFIGFQNAFNFFYPDRLRHNPQPPPIAVTSIKVMNKERSVITAEGDTFLLLRPGEDFFEVEFAALNFNQQERNRYAYQLEGFNKDWIYTDRPIATFTNLNGGTYNLHMKAANNDGVWNEKGTTLEIHVNPSFSKTRWFPLLIGLGLAGLGFGFLWFRRMQRKRIEKFRESLARDLHDEMGSTLSSIRFFSEYADHQIGNDKPQVTPMLRRISQSATNLSESMQDIIWAMKTDHDQLEDLTSHMMEFGLRLLESRNIQFKTHIVDGFSGKQLLPEVRRNVYLIFKEAVNNIAKYSEATEAQFDFALRKSILSMKIADNGKGFDPEDLQTGGGGNGLKNMRRRASEIGGKLEIFSAPGEGVRIELSVEV